MVLKTLDLKANLAQNNQKMTFNIVTLSQDPKADITEHISPHPPPTPQSPTWRAGFPSIVTCETESTARSAWPAIHSSWTDWWKTINRIYILLGHSVSQALILDTWTYILGNGAEVKHQRRDYWLIGSETSGGLGRCMELAWDILSVSSLSINNQ